MGIFQGAGSIALSHQMLKGPMTQKKVNAKVAGSQYSGRLQSHLRGRQGPSPLLCRYFSL